MAIESPLLRDLRLASYFLLVEHSELDAVCGGPWADWVSDYACLSGWYVPFLQPLGVFRGNFLGKDGCADVG